MSPVTCNNMHQRSKAFRVFDVISMLLLFNLYHSITFVLGLTHSNAAFVAFTLVLALGALASFLFALAKGARINAKSMLLLALMIVILIDVMLVNIDEHSTQAAKSASIYFICFAFPGYFAGVYLSQEGNWKRAIKYFDLIMTILIVASILYTLQASSFSTSSAGVDYQNISYGSAAAIGIDAVFLLRKYESYRFWFTSTLLYRIFQIAVIPIGLVCALSSGGRGGIVLSLLFCLFLLLSGLKVRRARRIIGAVAFCMVLIACFASYVLDTTYLQNGINRFLELFSNGVLFDTSMASSNSISDRNLSRDMALNLFWQSPIIGNGFFEYYNILGNYPHNIVLEILEQGGLTLLLLCSVLLVCAAQAGFKMYKQDKDFAIFLIPAVYIAVMLMFSGSYMNSTSFWCCMGLLLSVTTDGALTSKGRDDGQ